MVKGKLSDIYHEKSWDKESFCSQEHVEISSLKYKNSLLK